MALRPTVMFGAGFGAKTVIGQVAAPNAVSEKKWIQKAKKDIEKRGTEGVCTGSKFGGPSCPPGSKRYNLAKTFKKMSKKSH